MSNLVMTYGRWRCADCNGIVQADQVLEAPDPFDPALLVFGCPSCRMCVQFERVCDVLDCQMTVTCGWPSETGYQQTCSDHVQWEKMEPT